MMKMSLFYTIACSFNINPNEANTIQIKMMMKIGYNVAHLFGAKNEKKNEPHIAAIKNTTTTANWNVMF